MISLVVSLSNLSACVLFFRRDSETHLATFRQQDLVPIRLHYATSFNIADILTSPEVVGGSSISGVAIAAKSINPTIRVLGAEPKGADDAPQSKASGSVITLSQINMIADGLRASLGDLTL
ncbi:hypothetical protein L1987_53588 [Smallanthus sonchifolius]|uniref:Uncharacterized protein n=1 Tax=Smallanthus sonchifolius TaxID=185202 RepID=A0ACB9EWY3_9ASTR|nr:hypothetical protein L1987_53588 [Smallanthus sonchifolius]